LIACTEYAPQQHSTVPKWSRYCVRIRSGRTDCQSAGRTGDIWRMDAAGSLISAVDAGRECSRAAVLAGQRVGAYSTL
jgi:hypothetical protein